MVKKKKAVTKLSWCLKFSSENSQWMKNINREIVMGTVWWNHQGREIMNHKGARKWQQIRGLALSRVGPMTLWEDNSARTREGEAKAWGKLDKREPLVNKGRTWLWLPRIARRPECRRAEVVKISQGRMCWDLPNMRQLEDFQQGNIVSWYEWSATETERKTSSG